MEGGLMERGEDIIAPNPVFITQSGTFPQQFSDASAEAVRDKEEQAREQTFQALTAENGVETNDETTKMWRVLSSLGSHDLSVMREALGMPTGVLGCHLRFPIWTVLFQYPDFAVTYESGFDDVPRFDAHLEVFGRKKTVKVQYDTPYVKGLPVVMTVREAVEGDEGAYQERIVRRTYEDPYTLELKELWEMVVNGKEIKTTAEDARRDLVTFGMVVRAGKFEV
jgi:predicted dehydrogenase